MTAILIGFTDVSYRESVCYTQIEKEVPNLLELEALKCIVLDDY